MKNKLRLVIGGIVLVLIGFSAGYYFGKNPVSIKINFPSKKVEQTIHKEGFETYENKELGFTFDYPNTYELWDDETSNTKYINLNDGVNIYSFEIARQNTETFFSSLPISKVVTYNGIGWNFHEPAPSCEGDNCTTTDPGYTMRKGNLLFTFVLGTPDSDLETADQILSTFKFL